MGADREARNLHGNTALMLAAEKNRYHVIEALLAAHADPRAMNYARPPCQPNTARAHCLPTTCTLRPRQCGVTPNLTPILPPNLTLPLSLTPTLALTLTRQCGKTALGMSRAKGSTDAAKRLLAAGAGTPAPPSQPAATLPLDGEEEEEEANSPEA